MKDIVGNKTEEAVERFLDEIDADNSFGPLPMEGCSYSNNRISDVLGCDDYIARKLFSEPSPFMYNEKDEVYIEVFDEVSNETVQIIISSETSDPLFNQLCDNICSKLPDVPYDTECGGYTSRQKEASSLYKVAIINKLQEDQYRNEIDQILSNYDFERWRDSNGELAFTNLLQTVQEEADSISRIVLICTNRKLVADRIKKDTSYKGILEEKDAEILRILTEEDARINFEFNKKYERCENIKQKVLVGDELAKARLEMLSKSYVTPDIQVLFKIYNLNQNAIPGRAKRKIRNAAANYIIKLSEEKVFKDAESAAEFKKKLIQRAQKLYLRRMKEIRYKLWSERKPETDLNELIPKY